MGTLDPSSVRALLAQAIALTGSEEKLGRAAGYTQNAIWQAKRRGRVTAEMAVAIDVATNGAIGRKDLRPDIFSPLHLAVETLR